MVVWLGVLGVLLGLSLRGMELSLRVRVRRLHVLLRERGKRRLGVRRRRHRHLREMHLGLSTLIPTLIPPIRNMRRGRTRIHIPRLILLPHR